MKWQLNYGGNVTDFILNGLDVCLIVLSAFLALFLVISFVLFLDSVPHDMEMARISLRILLVSAICLVLSLSGYMALSKSKQAEDCLIYVKEVNND